MHRAVESFLCAGPGAGLAEISLPELLEQLGITREMRAGPRGRLCAFERHAYMALRQLGWEKGRCRHRRSRRAQRVYRRPAVATVAACASTLFDVSPAAGANPQRGPTAATQSDQRAIGDGKRSVSAQATTM